MSFIFDDENLVNELLKSALDFKLKFTKEGQAANATVNTDFANLEALLANLEKQNEPAPAPGTKDPNAPPSISYEGDGPGPKLTSTNLEGLGALTAWLAANKMTVGGQRVAFSSSEKPPNEEDYQLYKLEPNAGLLEVADRSVIKQGFYVNKDLLVKFIVSRQAALAAKPNKVEEVQLGDLIADANRLLDAKIPDKYVKPEEKLPGNTALDTIPNPFDPKNSFQQGTIPLTVQDLNSPEDFNAWANKGIGLKLADGKVVTIKDQNWDKCAFINGLHERSVAMAERAIPADKVRMAYYAKMVTQLASQAGCKLGGQPGQNNAAPAKITGQQVNQIVSALPFAEKDIDFNRIETFLKAVEPVMANDSSVASTIQDTRTLIQACVSQYIINDRRIIPLGINVNQFARLMKDQKTPGKMTQPAADHLDRIIDNTRSVVQSFNNAYGSNLSDAQRSLLNGQIGASPTAASLYSGNAEGVAELRGTPSSRPAE